MKTNNTKFKSVLLMRLEKTKKGWVVVNALKKEEVSKIFRHAEMGIPEPICDMCCDNSKEFVYIPVLNNAVCPKCYGDWINRSEYYPEDTPYELEKLSGFLARLNELNYNVE